VARLPVISGDDFAKGMRKVGYIWDHSEGRYDIVAPSYRVATLSQAGIPPHKEYVIAKRLSIESFRYSWLVRKGENDSATAIFVWLEKLE